MQTKLWLILFFICTIQMTIAQNKRILDSLCIAFQKTNNDSLKVTLLISIAQQYRNTKPDTLLPLVHKALAISEKANNKKIQSLSLHFLGLFNANAGNYDKAISYYQQAIKLREETNEKMALAASLNNLANVYLTQKRYDLAMRYNQQSLEIKESIKDKVGIGYSLLNIGGLYKINANYDQALVYFQNALVVNEETKNRLNVSYCYNNIGDIYLLKKDYLTAQDYYQKSLHIKEELKDKWGATYSLIGLAKVYQQQNNYENAIKYAEKSLEIAQNIKAPIETKDAMWLLYELNKQQGNTANALNYFELYKSINDSLFNIEKSKSIAQLTANIELERKQKEMALLAKDNELAKIETEKAKIATEKKNRELEIMKKQAEAEHLIALAQAEKDKRKADSLYAAAQKAQLEADFLRAKEEKLKLEQEKQIAEQTQIRNTFLGVTTTFLIIIVFIIIGYYQKQKANHLLARQNNEIKRQQLEIADKNNELSQANEELHQQQEKLLILNTNLESQKQEVEFTYQQLKVTSDMLKQSINYASHIQEIILADTIKLQAFFTDLFIIYRPKDVVSGDFYWFAQTTEQTAIFALADCTGHGVPGAFMSMLGSTLLHETVNIKGVIDDPARILRNLRGALRKILKQAEDRNTDGMDIGICYFEKQVTQTKIIFAGAKTALYYVEKGNLVIINGDRIYLSGKNPSIEFQNKEAEVSPNSVFYFATDGFADQNNAARVRFGVKTLQAKLLTISHLPLAAQQQALETALDQHQGAEAQRDDISLVCLQV